MTDSGHDGGGSKLMQFVVPALLGAGTAAAGFAAFLYFENTRAVPQPQPAPTVQQATSSDGLTDTQRAEVEKTIEEYLLGNPQILVRMSEALEKHQTEQRLSQVRKTISESSQEIFKQSNGMEAGNPQGDVTVVEFSDYNCPYCKRAFGHLVKLIEKDEKIRVVMKEFPIFGERSEGAARIAIAAAKQDKYFDMHAALLKNRGPNNEQVALKLAEKLGLDMDKLRADANSEETRKIIAQTRNLGNRLGITGTPFYLVGDKVIPGAPENLLDVFEENITDIRKNGCTIAAAC